MIQVLLVEDDPAIREVVRDYLERKSEHEIQVTEAVDGMEGKLCIETEEFDMVLLDVMLPGMDGFALCRILRRNGDTPCIFLTARELEEDILYGYELGCDDYITKPFRLPELYAKMQAIISRARGTVGNKLLTCGNITMDIRKMQVLAGEEEIELPPKQYAILKLLMENKDCVITREQMITRLWGYDYEGNERVMDNHIKKLRQYLKSDGKQIKTVVGKGYKITGN